MVYRVIKVTVTQIQRKFKYRLPTSLVFTTLFKRLSEPQSVTGVCSEKEIQVCFNIRCDPHHCLGETISNKLNKVKQKQANEIKEGIEANKNLYIFRNYNNTQFH